ncbi:MAG: hypothetical protein LBU87_04620 [Lactobacillales bacterium]|jgi:hypothetical protein|nr:hypothetical protein [Lactobacillales bacterium]
MKTPKNICAKIDMLNQLTKQLLIKKKTGMRYAHALDNKIKKAAVAGVSSLGAKMVITLMGKGMLMDAFINADMLASLYDVADATHLAAAGKLCLMAVGVSAVFGASAGLRRLHAHFKMRGIGQALQRIERNKKMIIAYERGKKIEEKRKLQEHMKAAEEKAAARKVGKTNPFFKDFQALHAHVM